jgi:hypothetical protein
MVKTKVQHGTSEITITYPRFPFEGIFSGDGDGGYVCFICGRTMERGEAFTCVARLLEICEDSEVKLGVIEAVASLQVCLPCSLLSAHHRLKWAHNSKLTGLEICGFYAYARLLTETISRKTSDTRVQKEFLQHLLGDSPYLPVELDRAALLGGAHGGSPISIVTEAQCQRCHDTIEFGKLHVMFGISIDTPGRDGMTRSNVWRLGGYCFECSKQVLPLCDRLW